jgi:hypothetical protein
MLLPTRIVLTLQCSRIAASSLLVLYLKLEPILQYNKSGSNTMAARNALIIGLCPLYIVSVRCE